MKLRLNVQLIVFFLMFSFQKISSMRLKSDTTQILNLFWTLNAIFTNYKALTFSVSIKFEESLNNVDMKIFVEIPGDAKCNLWT